MTRRVTRLAPSPTGALHLGNARTFLITWAIARQQGWELVMRMEDLDSPRVRPESASDTLGTLRWLGIDWDGDDVLTQSDDLQPYRLAIEDLCRKRCVFACSLSRREIDLAASAPQEGAAPVPYPKALRPSSTDADRWRFEGSDRNYRFLVPDEPMLIHDEVHGEVEVSPELEFGDFVIWTKRGVPAYQLAVVVDDIRQGVTDVIRGDDLLSSAALQTLVYEALGAPPPRWWHLGLVVGEDGRRLAKRHGDTRLSFYRDAGVPAERVIGLIAAWSGGADRTPMTAEQFRLSFDLSSFPHGPVTFTQEDHQCLLSGTSRSSS